MTRGLRKRLYFIALDLISRIAPQDVRATHLEVMERGMKAYKEVRTRKTDDLPFMRRNQEISEREELATLIQNACAQTGMDWVYDHEALGVAEVLVESGYRKVQTPLEN